MSKYKLYKQSVVPTGSDILGPFYRPGSPTRTILSGEPNLFLSGSVKDTNGNLLSAYLDFWQADPTGKYDENGPNLRGIQQTIDGLYTLETVVPGHYDISDPNDPNRMNLGVPTFM